MTPEQIDLVQATFKEVAKIKEAAAEIFLRPLVRARPLAARLVHR